MKTTHLLPLLLLALVAGCTDPVTVGPPPAENPGFDLLPVPPSDSTLPGAPVDTAGILPSDQRGFPGTLLLVRTTHATPGVRRTSAAARVLFEDRSRPVGQPPRVFGFWGREVGPVLLNADALLRLPHRVRVRRPGGDSAVTAGVEYLRDMTSEYRPNTPYTWRAPSPDSISPFMFEIRTPDQLDVQAPVPGQVIGRNRDLMLRWTGRGPIELVISGFDPLNRRSQPLLRITPRANTGMLVLPAGVLRLLPADRFPQFVFTFVLSVRSGPLSVGGYPGQVLALAADVQNIHVDIR